MISMKKHRVTITFVMCFLAFVITGKMVLAATDISRVDLQQPMPSIGQKVSDVPVTTTTAGVKVTAKWYPFAASSSALSASQTFQAGSYFCDITIETESNYQFSSSARAYINGEEAGYFSRKSSSRIVLSTGGNITIAPNIVISNIDLIIPELLDGLTISNAQARTSTDGVVITETNWYMEDKVTGSNIAMQNVQSFIEGQTYYCVVLTKPAPGYEYTPMPHAYFGTEEAAYFGLRNSTWLTATSTRFIAGAATPDLGIVISRVDYLLPELLPRQKISELQATSTTQGIHISETKWHAKIGGEYALMDSSTMIEADKLYWILVETTANPGYYFSVDPAVYVNGQAEGYNYIGSNALGASIHVAPKAFSDVLLNTVEIKLPLPKHGQTTTTIDAPSLTTPGVIITETRWFSLDTDKATMEEMELGQRFISGLSYLCLFELAASEGYVFSSDTVVLFNGHDTKNYPSREESEIRVVFDRYELNTNVISEIEVQLSTPLAGEIPRNIVPTTSTKGIVSEIGYAWHHKVDGKVEPMLPTDEFAKNETYYCYIALSIEDGYTFDSIVRVLLNGKELTFTVASHGMFIQGDSYDFTLALASIDTSAIQRILQSITNPQDIAKIPNGAAKTVTGLGLPTTVTLVTDDGNAPAEVTWSVGSSFYDPKVPTAQTFVVQGIVSLPKGVVNPKNIPLSAQVNVTVLSDHPEEDESATVEFTIDSKVVYRNGIALPEIDVPAMIIAGRTMIPFRYFIETALGGTAHFDAATYTITATVNGHTIVMVIDDTTIYVDGKAEELTQAPTIVNSRTLVPLRMVDSIAQSVDWDAITRKATIIM